MTLQQVAQDGCRRHPKQESVLIDELQSTHTIGTKIKMATRHQPDRPLHCVENIHFLQDIYS